MLTVGSATQIKTLIPAVMVTLALLAGCAEEAPPVSVSQYMENPRLLEATMVRCNADRGLRYEVECVLARDASSRLQAAAEKARREELDRQSELKRKALREAQEAEAAGQRRALEEERLREEAEYHGQFEALAVDVPPGPGTDSPGEMPHYPENR